MASFVMGIDVVPVSRVERSLRLFGDSFIARFFTTREISAMPRKSALHMAGRIAAKEACMKALGVGWPVLPWTSLEILREPSGRPRVEATGRARRAMADLCVSELVVSLTHDAGIAVAVALGVKEEPGNAPGQ